MLYGDMPSTTGTGRRLADGSVIMAPQPQMICLDCGDGPYSAERGDYWYLPDDLACVCGSCGGEMELGREVTRWVPDDRAARFS